LGFISRRILKAAVEHVWRHGGEAPGPDGRDHEAVFGTGPESKAFQQSLRELIRHRRHYRLGPSKIIRFYDQTRDKARELSLVNLSDRVMLHALAQIVNSCLPLSLVNVCVAGVDARRSVLAAAVGLRSGCTIAVRSDLQAAFPSLDWQAVLRSELAQKLPPKVLAALMAVCGFYSPGIGVPIGLATSTALLDLACAGLDQRLARRSTHSYRYVDDLLVLGHRIELGDEVLSLIEQELGTYGLRPHADKTGLYSAKIESRFRPEPYCSRVPRRPWPVGWLGFELHHHGLIDIAPRAAARLLERTPDQAARILTSSFNLAQQGRRYQKLLRRLGGGKGRQGDQVHQDQPQEAVL
jgi:hypothetical protein